MLNLARQFAFAVIEDDYDHEFHFESQPLLPMAGYAPERVIYVGSLSKLLLPALRIGYIVAPAKVVDSLAQQVMLLDSMGNTLTEDAAADLIDSGEVRRHVRKVTQIYAQRRQAFADTLTAELEDLADFAVPGGGLAFWLRFRNLKALDRIEARALDAGIWIAPSRSYITRPDAARGLRLGFASLTSGKPRTESVGCAPWRRRLGPHPCRLLDVSGRPGLVNIGARVSSHTRITGAQSPWSHRPVTTVSW